MSERLYEGMFLLDASESAKNWSELESHVGTLLSKNQARLEYGERWPDQKLAYPVKGIRKGTYYLTYFRAATTSIDELRRDAELSEHVLRLLVVQEEFIEDEMKRRRDAAARRVTEEREAPRPAEAESRKTSEGDIESSRTPEEMKVASPKPDDEPAASEAEGKPSVSEGDPEEPPETEA